MHVLNRYFHIKARLFQERNYTVKKKTSRAAGKPIKFLMLFLCKIIQIHLLNYVVADDKVLAYKSLRKKF
jgi:hypothetical protein